MPSWISEQLHSKYIHVGNRFPERYKMVFTTSLANLAGFSIKYLEFINSSKTIFSAMYLKENANGE